jgi:hypothetical protein
MYLNATNLKLVANLTGAIATSQPDVHVFYDVYNAKGTDSKPSTYRSALSNTADVTILPAPTIQGTCFEIVGIVIHNSDTATVTVVVKTDDGTTQRVLLKKELLTGETIGYSKTLGWYYA